MSNLELEYGVKEDIKVSNINTVYDDIHHNTNNRGNITGLSIGFSIEKFPREFKKNFFSSIDYRFLIILIFSFILNISAVYYFKKFSTSTTNQKSITRIQEQFAHLLLESNRGAITSSPRITSPDLALDTKVITGVTEWIDNFSFNIFESLNDLPPLESAEKANEPASETRGYSKEELVNMRRSTAEKRYTAKSNLERKVESVGLLGLIASKEKNKNYDYIQDLVEYAAKNSNHLASVLSKLNTIKIPRYSNSSYLKKIKGISSENTFAHLRGERLSANEENSHIIENMELLNKVKTEKITRNVHYEEVKLSYLDKLPQPNAEMKKRSSNDVIRIVRSHMKALQDCYKQELKKHPGLKGRIVVRFIVNPDGVVNHASMISSTLNNPRMENCILARVGRWSNFSPCDPSFGNMTYRQKFAFGM